MAESYTLSRQELRILTELALKSPTTLVDGYRLGGLLQKVEQIVNGQYDLVSGTVQEQVP